MPESIVCFEDLHVGHVVLGVVLGVWEFGSVGVVLDVVFAILTMSFVRGREVYETDAYWIFVN